MSVLDYAHGNLIRSATIIVFLGETLCFIVFISMSSRFFNPRQHDDRSYSHIPSTEAHPTHPHHHHGGYDFKHALLFFVPAACDILGTTCMNVGLLFIPVSIYQMLRGALTLWVALFSFLFLKRTFERHHLISLGFVLVGVAIVGSSSMKKTNELMDDETGEVSPLIGILFVLGAQIL
jgi:drug/metabolite transporter (DMT)-like permease